MDLNFLTMSAVNLGPKLTTENSIKCILVAQAPYKDNKEIGPSSLAE